MPRRDRPATTSLVATARRAPSLPRRLLLLVGAVSLPLMVAGAGGLWLNYRDDRARVEALLLEQVRGLARLVDGQFGQAEALARTLAGSPTLARGDLETFKGELRAARDALSAGLPSGTPRAMLSLLDTEGARLLDTRAEDGNGGGLHALPHAQVAIETGQSQVSNLFIGQVTGLPIIAVAVPVFASDGSGRRQVRGAISIALPRTRLLGLVTEVGLPPGSAVSVLDRQGTIVARSLRDAETVGKLPMPAVLAALTDRDAGFAPRGTATLEAVPSTIAFARAAVSGYTVKLDIPDEVFVAPLRAALLRTAAAGLAVFGLGLGLALLAARRLVDAFRQVPRLAAAAATADGPPSSTGLAEADDLVAAIAKALGDREAAAAETRCLFESSPVGVIVSDTGGRVHQANDAFLAIVGRSRAELVAGCIRWDEITPEEWLAKDEAAIAEAVARGRCTPYEKEYVRPDGTRVPVLLSFGFTNRAAGVAATFVVDLAPMRDAEAARQASEEFAQSILNATSDCIIVLDTEGRVAFMNEPGRCQTEVDDLAQMIGRPVESMWPEETRSQVCAALAQARLGQVTQYTTFGPTAKGAPKWWDVTVSPLPSAERTPPRLLLVARDVTAARHAAETLRRNEERLRLAQNAGGIGAWEADLVTGLRHWSESTYRLWGLAPGTIITPECLLRLVHEDDRALMLEAVARAKGPDGPIPEVEFRIRRAADGALRCLNSRSEAVARDPASGKPLRQIGVMRDVTERREAEAALRANEARQRDLLATLNLGATLARDPDGTIRHWSDGCARLYGWTAEEAVGQNVHDLLATCFPVPLPAIEAALLRDGEWCGDLRQRTRDGREIVVAARKARRRGTGRPGDAIMESLIDVTEQRRAAAALAKGEARFRATFEQAAVGIAHVALDGRWLRVNERLCDIVGYRQDELVGLTFQDITHPDDLDADLARLRALLEGGIASYAMEKRYLRKEGTTVWVNLTVTHVRDIAGEPGYLLGVVEDISARKAAEAALARAKAELEARVAERTRALSEAAEELRTEMRRREEMQGALAQAQKLEALGQLTGSVAHDFNNVLAAVMGSLRLIARRATGNAQILTLVEGGERAAERAAALIRQLMAFARREELQPVVVQPVHVLEEVDHMLRRAVGTGVTLSLGAAPDTWPVLTDPHRLEVALLNLVVNARDAMKGSGMLRVEARNAANGPGASRPNGLGSAQDYVVVAVRDNGPGMPPEVLTRAAEPFFTTKPRGQGTGLGLAMVHGFARQSGGTLHLVSVQGGGTTAEIWLPRAARDVVPAEGAAETEPDPALHGSATILVVDDDDQVRLVVATHLRDLGYEVIEADGMASAMVQAAAAGRLDLVVTDVTMPGGRGPDLALRLRATRPGIPILFVTGYGEPGDLADEVVLAKPFSPAELSRRMLASLGRLPASIHERMLMRLSRPELRGTYVAWRALREAAGGEGLPTPDAFDIAGRAGEDHAFMVAVEGDGEDGPRLRFVRVGAALAKRIGRPLEGEAAGGELDEDEVFGGLGEAYRRCARLGVPCHDYARFGFGDGREPLYFERLLLPLAVDGSVKPTHLVGMAFFSDPV